MISDVITYSLEARGWSPVHLAARLRDLGHATNESTVRKWMSGDMHPRLNVVPDIAEVLGVSCDTLLKGGD